MRRFVLSVLAGLATAAVLAGEARANLPGYRLAIFDLRPEGGDGAVATGVNEAGQVVGFANLHAFGFPWERAFVSGPGGALQDLGDVSPDGIWSLAYGINDRGQIVGQVEQHVGGDVWHYRAVRWTDGAPFLLDDLPGQKDSYSVAYDVDLKGRAVGQAWGTDQVRAVLWSEDGTAFDLGDLGSGTRFSIAQAINETGMIVGVSGVVGGAHAVAWKDGVITDLGDLDGGVVNSLALGLNGSGHAVGWGHSAAGQRAVLWDDAGITDLFDGVAFDINDSGWVVGRSGLDAVLWRNGGLTDLNALLPAGSPRLSEARGVSNLGHIVGRTADGRAFLLTPVPEPHVWLLLFLGFGLIGAATRRARFTDAVGAR